jgi:putative ABC transport system ATP-binding protein
MAAIEVRGVSKSFDEGQVRRDVLSDLSLSIEPGEIVAIVGRSGSGKSTLLNIIAGIERPTAGSVTVDGVEVSGLAEKPRTLFRRERIGFVFQFFNLLPTLTVAENVMLPLELTGRADGGRVKGLLEAVGLGDRGATFPDRLSGGEQQRVAVARALAHEPGLVLADEPTGALDADTGRAVLALLVALARGGGRRTVLLVTHSMEVARAADRVLVLESGHLAASG